MPFNGSGTFVSLAPPDFPALPFTTILASEFNANMNDIFANGLTKCLTRDGQSPPTANLPMAGFKFTGLGNGSSDTDSAALGQVAGLRGQVGAVDWDTRTTTGLFEATASSLTSPAANFPPTTDLGELSVIAQGALVNQIYTTMSTQYYRMKIGGTWSIWTWGVANKNYLVNSAFEIAQDGTSLASGSGKRYLPDMWFTDSVGTTYTPSLQGFAAGQTDVDPSATQYFRNVVVTSAGAANYCAVTTSVEDVRTLNGRTVTFSFWAKCSAANPVTVEMVQNFGSGGSSTILATFGKITLTTSWARYTVSAQIPSISGKTIGGSSCLQFNIWLDAGSNFDSRTSTLGQRSGTYDIWGMKLEDAGSVTRYEVPDSLETLDKCYRYYVLMAGTSNYCPMTFSGDITTGTSYFLQAKFPSRMVATPSCAVATIVSNLTFSLASITPTQDGVQFGLLSSVTGGGGIWSSGYSADARY